MGRRKKRRKATREEKIKRTACLNVCMPEPRGRIEFEDLSRMTQNIVVDIAKMQRCTKEEIVNVLNEGVAA